MISTVILRVVVWWVAKIHFLGQAPVLSDGDVVLAEAGAIFEYLMDHYGGERQHPTDRSHRIQKSCRSSR